MRFEFGPHLPGGIANEVSRGTHDNLFQLLPLYLSIFILYSLLVKLSSASPIWYWGLTLGYLLFFRNLLQDLKT